MIRMFTHAKYVVTHPGPAHMDDVLAVSFILAGNQSLTVYRREPTRDDLNDPQVVVVDIGNRWEPSQYNFDHHQERGGIGDGLPCATTLILRQHGAVDAMLAATSWLPLLEVLDNHGPAAAAKYLGISDEAFGQTVNPLAIGLVRQFGKLTELKPGNPLHGILADIGLEYLEFAFKAEQRQRDLESVPQLLFGGHRFLDLRGLSEPTMGFDKFVRANPDLHIVGSVSRDDRGPGDALFRVEGAPFDFCRVALNAAVGFVHRSGFLAKTKEPLTNSELYVLMEAAIIPAQQPEPEPEMSQVQASQQEPERWDGQS